MRGRTGRAQGAGQGPAARPVGQPQRQELELSPRIRASAPAREVRPAPARTPAATNGYGRCPRLSQGGRGLTGGGREQGPEGPATYLGYPAASFPSESRGQRPRRGRRRPARRGRVREASRDEQGHHQGAATGRCGWASQGRPGAGGRRRDSGERRGEVLQRTLRGQAGEQWPAAARPRRRPHPRPGRPRRSAGYRRPAAAAGQAVSRAPRARAGSSLQLRQRAKAPLKAGQVQGSPSGARGQPGEEGQDEGEHRAVDVQQEGRSGW